VIVFTDEMIKLAETPEQLLAILGHEIGHIAHRHALRRVIQDSTLATLAVLITGDISSASSLVVILPSLLIDLSYSREFEREADQFALNYMVRHQLQPQHFANIMQALERSHSARAGTKEDAHASDHGHDSDEGVVGRVTPYFSTHPATQNRIERFANYPLLPEMK